MIQFCMKFVISSSMKPVPIIKDLCVIIVKS